MKRSRYAQAAVLAALVILAALAAGGSRAMAAQPAHHTVIIKVVMYTPAALTVHRGDVIIWKNEDPVPHTVTADHGEFDSGSIAPGKSWRYVAKRQGEYAYHCTLHPNMHGTVMVQ